MANRKGKIMKKGYKQAKAISKKYNFPLLKKWEGYKLFWHVWHQPKLIFLITYPQYLDRIINIEENKPQEQKVERYKLMKPALQKFKADAAWAKADAALAKADATWNKAYAAWNKAYAALGDAAWVKAYAAWKKACAARAKADAAWAKADAAWEGKNHDLIIAHTKECPGCKWDGEKLPQMDWI